MLDHVRQIRAIYHYSAPCDQKIIPYTIQPGNETVELISGGTVFFEKDGERRAFRQGTIFWHVAGEQTVCETIPSDPYRCFVFSITVDPDVPGRPCQRVSAWNQPDEAMAFCRETMQAFHAGTVATDALTAYIYAVLLYHARIAQKLSELPMIMPLHWAIRLIKERKTEELSVDDIAERVGVSRSYLFRLFKTYLNISPHQYQIQLRIELAKLKLASESSSIKEIAADCGFGRLNVFYRRFKALTLLAPAEYRRKYSTI